MSEQNDITLLDVQRKIKPKIEDVIPLIIDSNEQKNVLDFVAWLCENKLSPRWSGVHNAWDAKYKGRNLCKVSLDINGQWRVRLYLINIEKYGDLIIREGLQKLIKNNLHYCKPCHKPCNFAMKENKQFFGEAIKGICYDKTCLGGLLVVFDSPNEVVINDLKILLEMEREARTKI